MSKSRDSRIRRCSRRQARARLRQLVWARVGPLAQREPLLNAYYQTSATIHHLAYNYLIHAEIAHCNDDKCLRDRGHPGLPPWPEHLACPTFADDNAAICAITTALAVRDFAQRILADCIRGQDVGLLLQHPQRLGSNGPLGTYTPPREAPKPEHCGWDSRRGFDCPCHPTVDGKAARRPSGR